ncbi:hypothetical protein [Lichenibacterium dinghuense]|nr:hypothetical protein [Lichenibacterium sp. 6Y81]
MPQATPLRLLRTAEPTRSAPRPSFVTAAGRFDLEAIMLFARAATLGVRL